MEFISGLDEKDKKFQNKQFEIIKNLTVWSDLLGFGKEFYNNQWELNPEAWQKIDLRLKNFYRQHYLNFSSLNEYIFILNDAVVRTIPLVYNESSSVMNCYPLNNHIYEISMWIRTVIISHINVNKSDEIGARTVLSYGERFNSFLDEITVDDLVYNYTKKDKKAKSQLALNTGDYTLMHNPRQLQMNTAVKRSAKLGS